MALICCPECSKEISDKSSSCIHCGYPIKSTAIPITLDNPTPVTVSKKREPLGELHKNPALGIPFIILGIISIIGGIVFLVFPIIGIPMIIFSFLFFALGSNFFSGVYKTQCPYCLKEVQLPKTSQQHKCSSCHKISVRHDNFLETVPD